MPTAAEILKKRLAPTSRSSAEILAAWPQKLRAQAIFSARVTEERYLAAIRKALAEIASGSKNAADARLDLLRSLEDLGYDAESGGFPNFKSEAVKPGTITDLSSRLRLDATLRTCRQVGHALGQIAESQANPILRGRYPAWELVRDERRKTPRDWYFRWYRAGSSVHWIGAVPGRMIALKDSPIWDALGTGAGGYADTLGNPYPPFAWGSGMGWESVDRATCIQLGLIQDSAIAANSAESQSRGKTSPESTPGSFAPDPAVQARRDKIARGEWAECDKDDARAILEKGLRFTVDGAPVYFGRYVLRHYASGERRKDNIAKPDNLKSLSMAIWTVRHCSPTYKMPTREVPSDGGLPRGTQRVYSKPLSRNRTFRVYVYDDTGVVSGWHVEEGRKRRGRH